MSFIPRISMFCIQFGFMVTGIVFLIIHSGESKDVNIIIIINILIFINIFFKQFYYLF
jgi:hypothetical protein